MEKESKYIPSSEEVKKAEEMTSDKEKEISEAIYEGFQLGRRESHYQLLEKILKKMPMRVENGSIIFRDGNFFKSKEGRRYNQGELKTKYHFTRYMGNEEKQKEYENQYKPAWYYGKQDDWFDTTNDEKWEILTNEEKEKLALVQFKENSDNFSETVERRDRRLKDIIDEKEKIADEIGLMGELRDLYMEDKLFWNSENCSFWPGEGVTEGQIIEFIKKLPYLRLYDACGAKIMSEDLIKVILEKNPKASIGCWGRTPQPQDGEKWWEKVEKIRKEIQK